jgi:hypothetical protein
MADSCDRSHKLAVKILAFKVSLLLVFVFLGLAGFGRFPCTASIKGSARIEPRIYNFGRVADTAEPRSPATKAADLKRATLNFATIQGSLVPTSGRLVIAMFW